MTFFVHTYVRTYIRMCMPALTHTNAYTRTPIHTNSHTRHTKAHTQVLSYQSVSMCTCVRTYECTSRRLCILTRTNTHTDTRTYSPDDRCVFHDDVDCFISVYNRNLHSVVPSRCFRLFGRLKTEAEKGVEG